MPICLFRGSGEIIYVPSRYNSAEDEFGPQIANPISPPPINVYHCQFSSLHHHFGSSCYFHSFSFPDECSGQHLLSSTGLEQQATNAFISLVVVETGIIGWTCWSGREARSDLPSALPVVSGLQHWRSLVRRVLVLKGDLGK